jgi:Ceramidase
MSSMGCERSLYGTHDAQDRKRKTPLLALLGLMAASLAILPLLPPIAQDAGYHQFADQRTLLGIPNFWNVISNFPFVVVGAVGLWQFGRDRASFVLFLGIFLTGFGSAYYHWNPNNDALFWDRLPMALTFMAILAVAVEERVSAKTGAILLWPARARSIQPPAVALD